ncbi:MAG TPA: hypothetical protein VGF18_05220 [Candidatus Tumulicola sp.]
MSDTIDLAAIDGRAANVPVGAAVPREGRVSPGYLQFVVPPAIVQLGEVRAAGASCRARIKAYEYGVVSLRLSFDAAGSWQALAALADRVRTDGSAAALASDLVSQFCDERSEALDDRHTPLVEDYFVIGVHRFVEPMTAQELLDDEPNVLAGLLLGERRKLASEERSEALRTRFSYFEDDLTVVQWDTAFIFDRPENARAVEDILEFANSQLLELRTYDTLLDRELDRIYEAGSRRIRRSILGRQEADEAESLRYLIVDVLELIDRSSNALKVVGDAYDARIYRAAAQRLGLADWQRQIDRKLASVGEIYGFFTDDARSRRDAFLEVIVIVLIALELIVGIATLFHH